MLWPKMCFVHSLQSVGHLESDIDQVLIWSSSCTHSIFILDKKVIIYGPNYLQLNWGGEYG